MKQYQNEAHNPAFKNEASDEIQPREPMKYNISGNDFNDIPELNEDSIEAKLYQIIDDIDTAFDMFKPEMRSFEKYISGKIKEAYQYIISDGYKLYAQQRKIGE